MNKYFQAVLANYIFFITNTLFFLIITSIAIREMGEEFFGLWTIINAIMLFSGVGTLGMGVVVNKFGSETGEGAFEANIVITSGILILLPMAGLGVGIILLLRGWMTSHINVSPALQEQFRKALVFTAFTLFPQFIARVPIGYLHSQLKNYHSRLVEISGNIALWVGAVLIAMYTRNLVLIALWGLMVQTLAMVVLFSLVKNMGVLNWQFHPVAIRRMLNYSSYTFLENIAMALYQQFDRIIVGFVLGAGVAGVYAVGTSVGLRLSMIIGQVTDVMLPYASRKNALNEQPALYEIFHKLSGLTGLLLASIGSLLILWMYEILRIWISQEYADMYSSVFRLLAFAYIPISLSRPGHQTLAGIGHVRFTSMTYIISSVIMLSAVYILSLKFGLMGAAGANLFMTFLLIFNISVYRKLAGLIPWRDILSNLCWALFLPGFCLGLTIWQVPTGIRLLVTFLVFGLTAGLAFQNSFIKHQALQLFRKTTEVVIFKDTNL